MVQIHNIIKSRFKIMFNIDKLSNKIIHINHWRKREGDGGATQRSWWCAKAATTVSRGGGDKHERRHRL